MKKRTILQSILLPVCGSLASLLVCSAALAANTAPSKAPDLERAKQTAAQVCAACHGADGNSAINLNPKLAGQHAAYLYKQLANFKAQNGKPAERNNAVMAGMVAALSDEELKGLAAFYAAQKPGLGQAKNKDTVEYGQKLWRAGDSSRGIPACAACHGPAGAGIPNQYPRLSGQHAEYTESQLNAFRAGARSNDANQMMRTIALRMTDRDIKALADYIAGLR